MASPPSFPHTPEADDFRRFCKRAWARPIRKVWAADPLGCPQCGGCMRIIAFIDDRSVIEKILRHLKLWDLPERSPPRRSTTTMEPALDFLEWVAAARQSDGID